MDPTRRKFLLLTGASALAAAGCGDDPPAADASASDAALSDVPPDELTLPDVSEPEDVPSVALDAGPSDAATDDASPTGDSAVPSDTDPSVGLNRYPEETARFPYGVMAGDMVDDRAILWTYSPVYTALTLELYALDAGPSASPFLTRDVSANPEGFIHTEVSGLTRGAWYGYTFISTHNPSAPTRTAVGRFRATLADDALTPVTLGATSCSHQRARPFPTMLHAGSRRDLDLFAHLGDLTYCDGARTAAQYRAKYAENLTSTGLRALFSSTGVYSTWDDHEVDNNFDPETFNAANLAAARGAFFEHRALRRDPAAPDRIYRSARWGRTLEVFTLDSRGERRPSTRTRDNAQYLSRAQMDWLKAGLRSSTSVFKVILNSVPISDFPLLFISENDRWEGYRAAREEILTFILAERIRDVWWVSGDFHMASVGYLSPSGPYAGMREVLVGPAGNNANPLGNTLGGSQFDFSTGTSNYGTFRFDPADRSVTVALIDGNGRTLFTRRYTS
ncbi:MAG: alkaline phosphatase D family protein [Deltaproteobacteria bacterium]|nr:alkaline phosphatase D family protein [Deltaproteobacteria bacterium]